MAPITFEATGSHHNVVERPVLAAVEGQAHANWHIAALLPPYLVPPAHVRGSSLCTGAAQSGLSWNSTRPQTARCLETRQAGDMDGHGGRQASGV